MPRNKQKPARDYYAEIDEVLKRYEEHKPYFDKNIDWACNRIDWCHKWGKITKEQMEELADRATAILDNNLFVD